MYSAKKDPSYVVNVASCCEANFGLVFSSKINQRKLFVGSFGVPSALDDSWPLFARCASLKKPAIRWRDDQGFANTRRAEATCQSDGQFLPGARMMRGALLFLLAPEV